MRGAALKRRSSTLDAEPGRPAPSTSFCVGLCQLIACPGLLFLGSNYAQNLGFRL